MFGIASILPNDCLMPDQIVITEKNSQAKDVRGAIGSRYGDILPAEGHLFDLLEPDVVPAWKRGGASHEVRQDEVRPPQLAASFIWFSA
jgi:DNA topoisomerase IA